MAETWEWLGEYNPLNDYYHPNVFTIDPSNGHIAGRAQHLNMGGAANYSSIQTDGWMWGTIADIVAGTWAPRFDYELHSVVPDVYDPEYTWGDNHLLVQGGSGRLAAIGNGRLFVIYLHNLYGGQPGSQDDHDYYHLWSIPFGSTTNSEWTHHGNIGGYMGRAGDESGGKQYSMHYREANSTLYWIASNINTAPHTDEPALVSLDASIISTNAPEQTSSPSPVVEYVIPDFGVLPGANSDQRKFAAGIDSQWNVYMMCVPNPFFYGMDDFPETTCKVYSIIEAAWLPDIVMTSTGGKGAPAFTPAPLGGFVYWKAGEVATDIPAAKKLVTGSLAASYDIGSAPGAQPGGGIGGYPISANLWSEIPAGLYGTALSADGPWWDAWHDPVSPISYIISDQIWDTDYNTVYGRYLLKITGETPAEIDNYFMATFSPLLVRWSTIGGKEESDSTKWNDNRIDGHATQTAKLAKTTDIDIVLDGIYRQPFVEGGNRIYLIEEYQADDPPTPQ